MQNISLTYLANLALRRLWILILAVIVFAASAFSYAKLVLVPVYSASASILITNGGFIIQEKTKGGTSASAEDTISGYDLSTSVALTRNVVELLKAPNKFIDLADKLGDGYTYTSLMSKASVVVRDEDTFFVDITFNSTDGNEAMRLANAFADLACEEIPNEIKNAEVSVVSNALWFRKIAPNELYYTAVAAAIGLILSYLAVLAIDMLDKSIRGESEFLEMFDVPLIGSVPDFESVTNPSYKKYGYFGYGSGYRNKYGYYGYGKKGGSSYEKNGK